MVQTEYAAAISAGAHRATNGGARSRLARWIATDRVRAAGSALIVAHLAWRADVSSRGFLAEDDFVLSGYAAGSDLTPEYLFGPFNNHIMPGGLLIFWLMVRAVGLAYWPYLLLLLAGQAVLSVTFFRLLRRLLPAGWGVLVPLCVFLFAPLTLDTTAFWTTGALILPLQLAMVLAIGAQVKYVRSRQPGHLISLALSLLLGLLFFEKALLIAPLVFLMTACLFVTGGPIRNLVVTIRRYWAAWVVLAAVSAGYGAFYLMHASSMSLSVRAGDLAAFLRQLIGDTLIPGLVGGPWRWATTGDGAPLASPTQASRWIAWFVVLAVVVVTMALRPYAARAWTLLAGYTALVAALLAVTRTGPVVGDVAGLATRYVSDVVLVAALCVGVALFGTKDASVGFSPRLVSGALPRVAVAPTYAVSFGGVVALILGTIVSTSGFAESWALKTGRDYLATATADLAAAPPGTVFLDGPVPARVVWELSAPYNMQSHFFRPLKDGPVFVTEAEQPSMFDQSGRIRELGVEGWSTRPGPDPGCGYKVEKGQPRRLLLRGDAYVWNWVVHIGYLSSGHTTVVFRLGDAVHEFEARPGLHEVYFAVVGGDDEVTLTATDPSVAVCVDHVTVGNPVPKE